VQQLRQELGYAEDFDVIRNLPLAVQRHARALPPQRDLDPEGPPKPDEPPELTTPPTPGASGQIVLSASDAAVTGAATEADSKEQPWADDAPEYLSLSEARKLIDNKFSLQTLSRLCRPDGEVRYMRKGRRCKVHLADFRMYMKGQVSDPKWAAAYMNWLHGQKGGTRRALWKCQNPACGQEYPDTGDASLICPKCKHSSMLTTSTAPKPRR
jgi:hypothetical protein